MKKIKRIKLFLLIIMTVSLFSLSSCEAPTCEHKWGEWQFNENYHWRQYACEHKTTIKREWHIDDGKDGLCDVCNAEMDKISPLDIDNLDGKYYGECSYSSVYSGLVIDGKEFVFNDSKYYNFEKVVIEKIDGFFDRLSDESLYENWYLNMPLEKLKEATNIYYYETSRDDISYGGIYLFKVENDIYLFDASYSEEFQYLIFEGHRLIERREIYSLDIATLCGYLTHEDLEAVAELFNNQKVSSQNLDTEIKTQILKQFCYENNIDYEENMGSIRFYGEYNGSYVIMVDGCGEEHAEVEEEVEVDGVVFNYSDTQRLLVWNSNKK